MNGKITNFGWDVTQGARSQSRHRSSHFSQFRYIFGNILHVEKLAKEVVVLFLIFQNTASWLIRKSCDCFENDDDFDRLCFIWVKSNWTKLQFKILQDFVLRSVIINCNRKLQQIYENHWGIKYSNIILIGTKPTLHIYQLYRSITQFQNCFTKSHLYLHFNRNIQICRLSNIDVIPVQSLLIYIPQLLTFLKYISGHDKCAEWNRQ